MPSYAPLVSIVVNNYNYGHYLAEAIDSALHQTYRNVEVIVVDDGSTDNSVSIIQSYGDRIKALCKSNAGQASAFNAGFALSSGELIAFLDSDDALKPEAISTVVENWQPHAAKLQFPLEILDIHSRSLGIVTPRAQLSRGHILHDYLKTGRYVSSPTSGNVFNRRFLQAVLPMPEVEWRQTGDGYLNTAAPFYSHVLAIDQPLAFYRVHGDSMSSILSNGEPNLKQMEKLLNHASLERNFFFKLANEKGLTPSRRAVLGHWIHLKLRLSYDKLADLPFATRYTALFHHLFEMTGSVLNASELPLRRKLQHLLWTFAVVFCPRFLATKIIAYGFDTAPTSRLSLGLRRA